MSGQAAHSIDMELPEKRKFEATSPSSSASDVYGDAQTGVQNMNINEHPINDEKDGELKEETQRLESGNGKGAGKKQATDDTYTKNKQINNVGWNSSGIGSTAVTTSMPMTSPITAFMPCPTSKVAMVIGKKGATLNAIMKQSGCKIDIDHEHTDGSSRQIKLVGDPAGLAAAMALLSQVMEGNYSGLILSPESIASTTSKSKSAAHVSEKRTFSNSTNNQLSSSSSSSSSSDSVHPVKGHKAAESDSLGMQMNMNSIATALKGEFADSQIMYNNEKKATSASRSEHTADAVIMCPANKVGTLIGFKGSNINEIMRRTGCKIQIIQENVAAGVDRKVCVFGQRSQVDDAVRLMNTLILVGANALAGASDAPGTMYEENELPHEKVGLVIGAKGATISQIMQYCSCKININQTSPHGAPHRITYVGLSHQIELAKFLVDMVIEQGTHAMEVYCQSIAADPLVVLETKVSRALLVRAYGQNVIHEVERKYNVRVSFDDSSYGDNPCKTSIIGKRSAVNEAATFVQQFSEDQSDHVDVPAGSYASYLPYASQQQQQQPQQQQQLQQQQYQLLPQQVPGMQNAYSFLPNASNGLIAVMNPQSFPTVVNSANAPQVYSAVLPAQQQHQQIASSYQQQQQPQYQSVQIMASSGHLLALGDDGKAGHLEPPKLLPDGQYQQLAEIRNELVGKFLGKQSVNVNLIRSKSGVLVDVVKPLDQSKGLTHTAILLTGQAANVALAAQMIQEVLINGVNKLLQMADMVSANPSIAMASGSSPVSSLPSSYIAVQNSVSARAAADLSAQPLVEGYTVLKPEQIVQASTGFAPQAVGFAHGQHYQNQNTLVHVPQNMPAGIVYVQQGPGFGQAQPQIAQQAQQYGGAPIAYQQQLPQQQLQLQLQQQQQQQQQYATQAVSYSGQYGGNPGAGAATMIMMQSAPLQQLQSPQQFQQAQYYQQQQQQQSPQYSQQQQPHSQQQQQYQQVQSRPSTGGQFPNYEGGNVRRNRR